MMTFEQKIAGVPPELVEQGWRLCPDDAVLDAWTALGSAHRWESFIIGRLRLERPVRTIGFFSPECERILTAYAHAGWGEGLSPTPEMCKVWTFWWFLGNPARTIVERDVVWFYHPTLGCWQVASQYDKQWRGPVLLPTVKE